jgi:hypothetical protein
MAETPDAIRELPKRIHTSMYIVQYSTLHGNFHNIRLFVPPITVYVKFDFINNAEEGIDWKRPTFLLMSSFFAPPSSF